MSQNIDNIVIYSKIADKLRNQIKIIHVFDDCNGYNVLFITRDDKVFGFGVNTFGCCGLGHNSVVNEPQVIQELCNKNIKQFFIGFDFVLALSSDQKLYGWGQNQFGQLGRGFNSKNNNYLKPDLIILNEGVIQVSCGSKHTLVITSMGRLYGWGQNCNGQVGCGQQIGRKINKPCHLKILSNISIKSIYCSLYRSFALTAQGLVYSWGSNELCHLGHEVNQNEIFEPKLIDSISNVISFCPSTVNTYFLTNEEHIYFCGLQYKNKNRVKIFQKTPKLMTTKPKFSSLHSVTYYKKSLAIASAVSETSVYFLRELKVTKEPSTDVQSFYLNKFGITYNTVSIQNPNDLASAIVIGIEKLKIDPDHIKPTDQRIIEDKNRLIQFHILNEIGKGGSGTVFKVENKLNGHFFAIKEIQLKDKRESEIVELKREADILSKCSPKYVVQYFDSWIEKKNCLYIQMEFCSDNLTNIIQQKQEFFKKEKNSSMTSIEYYISCKLFEELLECVQYLHESNPPIIHRDLKPQNILINEKPINGRFLKLGDFGLAKFLENSTTITHTKGQGTQHYMAPEVIYGKKYNTKADIFSLSVILGELLNYDIHLFEPDFAGNDSLRDKWPALPELIALMRCDDYKRRPTSTQLLYKINNWSLSYQQLIDSDFNYCEVFPAESFFKHFYNSKTEQ